MADRVSISLKGVDIVQKKLGALMTAKTIKAALQAGGEEIRDAAGRYPPSTSANQPPVPYYQRGMGTVTASGIRRTSENLGKQWRVRVRGAEKVTISNRASYAQWVHGEMQARFHKGRGWKQLEDTARKRLPRIRQKLIRQWRRIIDLD